MKKILLSLVMLLGLTVAKAEDYLHIVDFEAKAGITQNDYNKDYSFDVELVNAVADTYTSLMFDLYLPQGMTLALDEGDVQCDASETRFEFKKGACRADFDVTPKDGFYRVTLYHSDPDLKIHGTSGAILTFYYLTSTDMKPGSYEVKVTNQNLAKDGSAEGQVYPTDKVSKMTIPEIITEIGKANIASGVTVYTTTSELGKDIPAAGGKDRAVAKVSYAYFTRTFLSNGTYKDGEASAKKEITVYGEYVEKPSLEQTIKERAIAGKSQPTAPQLTDADGKVLKAEGTVLNALKDCEVSINPLDIYQEANALTETSDIKLEVKDTQVNFSYEESTYDIAQNVKASQTLKYTSGASEEKAAEISYAIKNAVEGFNLKESVVSATSNNTDDARNGFVVTVTAKGAANKTATQDITFNQISKKSTITEVGKALIAKDVTVSATTSELGTDIPAAGGKDRAMAKVSYAYITRTFLSDGSYKDSEVSAQQEVIAYGEYIEHESLMRTLKERSVVGTSQPASLVLTDAQGNELKAERTDFNALKNCEVTFGSIDIYQQANEVISYGEIYLAPMDKEVNFHYVEGRYDISLNVIATQAVKYTSGAVEDKEVDLSYEVKNAVEGFTLKDGVVSVSTNETEEPRQGFVVTITATGVDGQTVTKDITFNQSANTETAIKGIRNINSKEKTYDLNGRKLNSSANRKGLVIKNNHKYIVK